MKIQFDIPPELDKKIRFYMTEHNIKNKSKAILAMLGEHPLNVVIK